VLGVEGRYPRHLLGIRVHWYTPPLAMDKDSSTIQSMFAEIAPRYDFLNRLLSLNIDQRWRRRTVGLTKPQGEVLDVCTGTGDLAAMFRAESGQPVLGIDFCAPMLQRTKHKKSCSEVRFARGDALNLPVPSDQFDVVSVAFGIRNVADLDRGLAELVRAARPGGRVAILEFTMPRNPVFGWFYRLYFGRVLPFLGNLVSRSRAYSYLNHSVLAWTSEYELAERLKRAGCAHVAIHPLSFGIAAVHVGVKEGG
jgi:demethylmenaquinone methyltransferase/2-methoxy-6-polyprenyl-1,4-benzoquinol methylase